MTTQLKSPDLVLEVINNPDFDVREDGTVWWARIRSNTPLLPKQSIRQVGTANSKGYVRFRYKSKSLAVHHVVWTKFRGVIPAGLMINHIDGNRQNNAVANLELTTNQQNAIYRKTPKTNTTGYRGVSKERKGNRWRAQIHGQSGGGRPQWNIYLGCFGSPEEAAQVYDRAALEWFGPTYALLNFPEQLNHANRRNT